MENLELYKHKPSKFPSSETIRYRQGSLTGVYGKYVEFDLRYLYRVVESFFLIIDITPSVLSSFATPTSPYIFDHIFLESAGQIVCRLTTTSILMRIEEEENQRLYDQILAASTIPGASFSTVKRVTLPLYFYAVDGQLLDLTKYKDLKIRCITKGSYEEMGFTDTLDALDIQLKINYYNGISKEIKLEKSYNITQNPTQVVTAGSTSVEVLINYPYDIVNLGFMVRSTLNASLLANITSVKIRYTTGEEVTYDDSSNFSLTKPSAGNEGSVFVINYGSRYDDVDFLKSNGNMTSVRATVYFNTLVADYNLFVCAEYISNVIEDNGHLIEKNDYYF